MACLNPSLNPSLPGQSCTGPYVSDLLFAAPSTLGDGYSPLVREIMTLLRFPESMWTLHQLFDIGIEFLPFLIMGKKNGASAFRSHPTLP